jgi:hypothetical protein
VIVPVTNPAGKLRQPPRNHPGFGEKSGFEVAGDWVWGQLRQDSYVGYIAKPLSQGFDNPTPPGFRATTFYIRCQI